MGKHLESSRTDTAHIQFLIEANQKLATVESVDDIIPILLSLARDVTDAEASSFLIYDAATDALRFSKIQDDSISASSQNSLKKSVEIPSGEGVAGKVAQQRRPLIIEDAQHNPLFFNKVDKLTGFKTRSILAVPVLYMDELLGVIEVINSKKKACFDAADQDMLVSFSNIAAVALIRARLIEERLQQEKIRIQMETATKIQSLFSPKLPPPANGSHIWGISTPAKFVGGDLYDIIPMPDNSWLVYVADVSDKGLPAALIMVALWYRIRSEAAAKEDICDLLQILNASLYELVSDEGYFVTILIGQYWPLTGKFEYANGGHLPALKIRSRGCEFLSGRRGLPLGVAQSSDYQAETVSISENEAILLLTDGITEAMNSESEIFGEQRMIQNLNKYTAPPWGRRLLEAIKKWQADTEQNDDLTMLEIWRKPNSQA